MLACVFLIIFVWVNSTFLLWFQKDMIEESIEIVIEKLLHANKDDVAKVIFFC